MKSIRKLQWGSSRIWSFVDVAENGEDAVDMCASNDYDAVLMDMQMPVMDGMRRRGSADQYALPGACRS